MKKLFSLFLIWPLVANALFGEASESSGTQSISIAAGASDRYELLSISLNADAVYTGTISSISGYAITLDSADFSDSDLTTYPHFLRIKEDGSNQGHVRLIIAHSTSGSDDSVTTSVDASSLSANDSVTIIPAHTLASLFGSSTTTVSGIAQNSGTVTVTSTSNHGLNTGDQVTITATGGASIDGDYTITRTGATTFTLDGLNGSGTWTGGTYYPASWPSIGSNTTAGDSTSNNEILVGKPSKGDNVIVWTTYGWKTYFYYNSKWQTYGSRAAQDNTVIYPDEGLVIVRRDTDSYALTMSGTVPAISSQAFHPASDNKFLLGNPYPVAIGLSNLAVDSAGSKWTGSNTASSADQVLVWTGSSWETFYKNASGNWSRVGDSINYSNPATATATIDGSGTVTSVSVGNSGGTGYSFASSTFSVTPSVSFSGDGSGAAATVTLSGDTIGSISVDSAGSGYSTAPTVTLSYPQIPSGAAVMIVRQSGGSGGNEYLQASSPY